MTYGSGGQVRKNAGVDQLPVIDVGALVNGESGARRDRAAREIGQACRDSGFFYISGHGVPPSLLERLDQAARRFFELPLDQKMEISMDRGGRAWRGFFPVGGELTSGRPDLKEGVYFGAELPEGDPRAGLPLHGRNLFPAQVPNWAKRSWNISTP